MIKSIETLKNIWNIEDLRQRILITILFVESTDSVRMWFLPGINPDMLSKLHEQTSEGLLALLNMFSGGAFSNASIFCIGNHAVYLCIHRDSVVGDCSSFTSRNYSARVKVDVVKSISILVS